MKAHQNWGFAACLTLAAGTEAAATPLNLVPWPAEVVVEDGSFSPTDETRLVPATPDLVPLAEILAAEFELAFEVSLPIDASAGGIGHIRLERSPDLEGEASRVTVTPEGATVEASRYAALAAASVTLLQAASVEEGQLSIPGVTIRDRPAVAYRGLMIDVARKPHQIETLERIIQLCRLYKIRYLQLHLTDDQGFKFPSTAYPQLATDNHSGPAYTLEELHGLEAYSQQRGVTIIPEMDIPGHSAAMNRTMPDLFKIKDTVPYEHHATINWAKADVMDAIDVLIGEMCAVFQATPYFHIGGDEADFVFAHQNEHFIARFQEMGYDEPFDHADTRQLFRRLLRDLDGMIDDKYQKQMLVWEGFHRDESADPLEPIPKHIPVMAFENTYYPADQLVADAYPVINTAWNPLYVVNGIQVSPENIYGWNLYQFGRHQPSWDEVQWVTVPEGSNVIGAQMCAWEQPENIEIDTLRLRLPAMSERIWNPDAGKTFEDFSQRLEATDALLSRIAQIDEWGPKVEIHGNYTNPNAEIGPGANTLMTGPTTFGWQTGTCDISIDTNGFPLTMDSGGGNAYRHTGVISGSGSLKLIGAGHTSGNWNRPIEIGGQSGNTHDGPTLVFPGSVSLGKANGHALNGQITVGGADDTARLVWTADDQIADDASVALVHFDAGAADADRGTWLDLSGHSDRIASLSLDSGTVVKTGAGGVLRVDSLAVDGVAQPDGSYISDTHFIEGSGYIDVGDSGPPEIVDPPAEPASPEPPDGASLIHPALFDQFDWMAAPGAFGYDIYLWEASASKPELPTATIAANSYQPEADLASQTDYRWQVVATNPAGARAGPVWEFSTAARWEIEGTIVDPNAWIGPDHPAHLTGDATFGWQTGTCGIDVNLEGFDLTFDSGGGNPFQYHGQLTGPGGLALEMASHDSPHWDVPMRIGGDAGNAYGGPTRIRFGTIWLEKSAGHALEGDITLAGTSQTARLVWKADDQIADTASLTLRYFSHATGTFLDLDGHSDTIAHLHLEGRTHLKTGTAGQLTTRTLTHRGVAMAPGTYTHASHPGIVDGSGALIVDPGGSPYATWAGDMGLSGVGADFESDPDGDGLPNGIEFLIGTNPNDADASSSPNRPAITREAGQAVFRYPHRHEAADLTANVEFNHNLSGPWITAVDRETAEIRITPGDDAQIVSVTLPPGSDQRVFVRLRVTIP